MGLTTFDEVIPRNQTVGFLDSSPPFSPTALWEQPPMSRIDAIWATNLDSIPHNLELDFQAAGVEFTLGTVAVPAGSGYTLPPINVLAALDPALATSGLVFNYNDRLDVAINEAVLSGNICQIIATGGLL